jgi:hypothetical protein
VEAAGGIGTDLGRRGRASARRSSLVAAIAAASLATALTGSLHVGAVGGGGAVVPAQPPRGAHQSLLDLPLPAQGALSAALGAREPAYRVLRLGGGAPTEANPAQGFSASFTAAGVAVRSRGTEESVSLRAVGFGSSLLDVSRVAPHSSANRVAYVRPGLSEWYANGPLGLEQGFTFTHAPAGVHGGPADGLVGARG